MIAFIGIISVGVFLVKSANKLKAKKKNAQQNKAEDNKDKGKAKKE
ncbi:MAG: hypothetical protein MJ252_29705 [archaeon]|nr:hypothetical protein [archaeon]